MWSRLPLVTGCAGGLGDGVTIPLPDTHGESANGVPLTHKFRKNVSPQAQWNTTKTVFPDTSGRAPGSEGNAIKVANGTQGRHKATKKWVPAAGGNAPQHAGRASRARRGGQLQRDMDSILPLPVGRGGGKEADGVRFVHCVCVTCVTSVTRDTMPFVANRAPCLACLATPGTCILHWWEFAVLAYALLAQYTASNILLVEYPKISCVCGCQMHGVTQSHQTTSDVPDASINVWRRSSCWPLSTL